MHRCETSLKVLRHNDIREVFGTVYVAVLAYRLDCVEAEREAPEL